MLGSLIIFGLETLAEEQLVDLQNHCDVMISATDRVHGGLIGATQEKDVLLAPVVQIVSAPKLYGLVNTVGTRHRLITDR